MIITVNYGKSLEEVISENNVPLSRHDFMSYLKMYEVAARKEHSGIEKVDVVIIRHNYGLIGDEISKIDYEKFRDLNLFEMVSLRTQFPEEARSFNVSTLGVIASGFFAEGCALTLTADRRFDWHVIWADFMPRNMFRKKFAFALAVR